MKKKGITKLYATQFAKQIKMDMKCIQKKKNIDVALQGYDEKYNCTLL